MGAARGFVGSIILRVCIVMLGAGGCNQFGLGGLEAGKGGVGIICKSIRDDQGIITGSIATDRCGSGQGYTFSPPPDHAPFDNKCNCGGFYAPNGLGCSYITTWACVPREVSLLGSPDLYSIENEFKQRNGWDLKNLPPSALKFVEEACRRADGWVWCQYTEHLTPHSVDFDLCVLKYRSALKVYDTLVENPLTNPDGSFAQCTPSAESDPVASYESRPVEFRPDYCWKDTPYDQIPDFVSLIWIATIGGTSAGGFASIQPEAGRSPLIITVVQGDQTRTAATNASGWMIAQRENCQIDSAGVRRCDFRINALSLSLDPFNIADTNVVDARLHTEGLNAGQTVGNLGIIPQNALQAIGQFKLEGQDPSVVEFTNERSAVIATWDPEGSNVEITLNLRANSPDGSQSVFVDGTIGGSFLNRGPVADPGQPQTVECASPQGTVATLDGSHSFDLDGNLSDYLWMVPVDSSQGFAPGTIDGAMFSTSAITTTAPLSLGEHAFSLKAADTWGYTDTDSTTVRVVDTLPPDLQVTISPDCIWPPNHEMVRFDLGREIQASAVDQCTGDVSNTIRIVDVVSNQPVVGRRLGSGDTTPDAIFGDTGFCIRAERDGTGSDRIYSVTLQATDSQGNVATKVVTVRVPHDAAMTRQCKQAPLNDDTNCEFVQAAGAPNPVPQQQPSSSPNETINGGCSVTTAPNSGYGSTALLLAFVLPVSIRRRARVVLLTIVASMVACSSNSPGPSSNQHASIDVQVNGNPDVMVTAVPNAFLMNDAIAIRVATGDNTVFISAPRSVLEQTGSVTVGVAAGQAVVWAKTAATANPLTASDGMLKIQGTPLTTGGHFILQVVNATKAADPSGPSVAISGTVEGNWQ